MKGSATERRYARLAASAVMYTAAVVADPEIHLLCVRACVCVVVIRNRELLKAVLQVLSEYVAEFFCGIADHY